MPKREICTQTVDTESAQQFIDAVQRHYWWVWGQLCERGIWASLECVRDL